jgi:hypothetical protein
MPDEHPQLIFFRNVPPTLAASEFLANSMQSLETSFILTAARRHVHALLMCFAAIEGALHAAPIEKDRDRFLDLIKKSRGASARLREFPEPKIEYLRNTRNAIVHRGFSPRDNSRCVDLLIDVGLPLLNICYEDFHSINIYRDLRQDHAFAKHLNISEQAYSQARDQVANMTYCIGSFAHLVRRFLQPDFSSDWEYDLLTKTEAAAENWELKENQKKELETLFSMPWTFDCPICEDLESLVCDLQDEDLTPGRMACTNCGYVVHDGEPFIGEILLREQLTEALKQKIREEYGLA